MKVFAHRPVVIPDRARKREFAFGAGQYHELPDDLARYVTEAPQNRARLCLIPAEHDPAEHRCELTDIVAAEEAEAARLRGLEAENEMMDAPPEDRAVRYSPQKRRVRKEASKRSRTARREVRGEALGADAR